MALDEALESGDKRALAMLTADEFVSHDASCYLCSTSLEGLELRCAGE